MGSFPSSTAIPITNTGVHFQHATIDLEMFKSLTHSYDQLKNDGEQQYADEILFEKMKKVDP